MTFVVGSYQAVEHPGGGHRTRLAGLWRGEDLRTLNEVAMIVLPAECSDAARREVESVAALRHPHLLPVIDVVDDSDRVAVVCPWPAGGRLAELVGRRGRLSVGETLTVLTPVAGALAAAHGGGIRHGGLCPEAVWFDLHGRPLVGSLAVSRLIAGLNDGMPIGCRDVAPEVVRGERLAGGGATTAADVFSLGSVALYCLTGRSAWPADDPADVLIQSAAGLWPDPPDDAGPAGLVDLVRAMLRAEPMRRPTVEEVATRLATVGEPEPIAFTSGPAPAAASADRWRGWSAVSQLPDPPTSAGSGDDGPAAADEPDGARRSLADPAADADANADAAAAAAAESVGPDERSPSVRRREALRSRLLNPVSARPADSDSPPPGRITPLARVGIALLAGLLITVVAVQVGAWWTGWDRPASSASATPSWSEVVAELDAARGRALAAADPALLTAVYLDAGSPAGAADAATIEQLADKGWRVLDGVHEIVSVTTDGPNDPEPTGTEGGAVRLAVVDILPSRAIVDAAGDQVGLTPARPEQRRILVVGPTDDGYRILAVESG